MTSEDEAYDPWPGCMMTRTGCHWESHRSTLYRINESFAAFFTLSKDDTFTLYGLDDIVIEYAEKRNGVLENRGIINYDEALWDFFSIEKDKSFKYHHIEDRVKRFLREVF
jgi:hypothetical protein